jgi:hypothetical protein
MSQAVESRTRIKSERYESGVILITQSRIQIF